MDLKQEVKDLKEKRGVNYKYVADKIGVRKQNFYKFLLDENDKNYQDLSDEKKELLIRFLIDYYN